MRAGAYSPNHIGNDAAIFNAVADNLRKRGCIVNIYSEEQFLNGNVEEQIIVNMCREIKSIHKLQKLEDEGRIIINSGYGIENCTRERMTRILVGSGIPYPESLIVNTNECVLEALRSSGFEQCWIKRGDFHAMHKEDVSYVRHAEEAQEVVQEYFLRGIKRASDKPPPCRRPSEILRRTEHPLLLLVLPLRCRTLKIRARSNKRQIARNRIFQRPAARNLPACIRSS